MLGLPEESGRYKYVLIEKDGGIHLVMGSEKSRYEMIAQKAFEGEMGIVDIMCNMRGGGRLNLNMADGMIKYHNGPKIMPPEPELLDRAMGGVALAYEYSLLR